MFISPRLDRHADHRSAVAETPASARSALIARCDTQLLDRTATIEAIWASASRVAPSSWSERDVWFSVGEWARSTVAPCDAAFSTLSLTT
jgi:hypothetical protein